MSLTLGTGSAQAVVQLLSRYSRHLTRIMSERRSYARPMRRRPNRNSNFYSQTGISTAVQYGGNQSKNCDYALRHASVYLYTRVS